MSEKVGKESQYSLSAPFVRLGGGRGRDTKKSQGKGHRGRSILEA